MIREAIIKLSNKENLSYEEAEQVMNEIMEGQASQVQMAAYLTALSIKGENIDEITASAAGMRAHCIKLLHDMDVLEIVGTGGDGANSFNISTTASLVIAAGGVPVAKHGNRAASSKSGAADVLEALGVKIDITPEQSAELLKKIGICFLFAQNYHIAMKYVAPIRKELSIRTVFNILGPLSNPAGANMELMGVYEQALVEPLAQVMAKLGVTRGMVVYGQDKLDEISMSLCHLRLRNPGRMVPVLRNHPGTVRIRPLRQGGADGRNSGRKCRHHLRHLKRRGERTEALRRLPQCRSRPVCDRQGRIPGGWGADGRTAD